MATKTEDAKKKSRFGGIMRSLLWIGLLVILLVGAGYYLYRTYTISEGSRTGTLFKISKKGVIFKTYEGQLHLAGSVMLTEQSTWDFSAKDEAVYQQLQQFEGKNVKLHYKQKVDAFIWQGETDYIVWKAEPVQ